LDLILKEKLNSNVSSNQKEVVERKIGDLKLAGFEGAITVVVLHKSSFFNTNS
jgi:hypothetical protein